MTESARFTMSGCGVQLDDDLVEYYFAPGGSGTLAAVWVDNPARLIDDLVRMCQEARDAQELAEQREFSCYAWARAARDKSTALPPSRALRWIDEMGRSVLRGIPSEPDEALTTVQTEVPDV